MSKIPCNNGKWSLGYYSRGSGQFTYNGAYDTAEQACAAAGMKAWSYDATTNSYIPYNTKYDCCRAECAVSNNRYLIENTYTVAFRSKPLELSSHTEAILPINRDRKVIGVGENVTITANCLVPEFYGVSLPQLKETDLWQAYCM
ncbi:hypothetical protein ACFQ3H_10300, partial [Paralysiella testudinis]